MFVRCEPASLACMERTKEVFFGMLRSGGQVRRKGRLWRCETSPLTRLLPPLVMQPASEHIDSELPSVGFHLAFYLENSLNSVPFPRCTAGDDFRYSRHYIVPLSYDLILSP
jgi:hypothetical protein